MHAFEVDTNGTTDSGRLYGLASWLRPPSRRTVVASHLPLALAATVALLLPYCVTLEHLPQIPCTFLHLTGYPCPFCGFTRSFWALAAGKWAIAVVNCPLSFTVYFAVGAVFLWNFAALAFGVVLSRGAWLQLGPGYRGKVMSAVLMLLAANWIYRIAMGFDVA